MAATSTKPEARTRRSHKPNPVRDQIIARRREAVERDQKPQCPNCQRPVSEFVVCESHTTATPCGCLIDGPES